MLKIQLFCIRYNYQSVLDYLTSGSWLPVSPWIALLAGWSLYALHAHVTLPTHRSRGTVRALCPLESCGSW